MTLTELTDIIANGESSGIDFKRDAVSNVDLAKELVAFSNFEGGVVLLGVEDDGTISGVTRPNVEEWVMTTCRDKIRPAVIPYFELIKEVEPGRDVALVRVTPGFNVQTLWHNNKHSYYIRVGSQSREMTPEELSRQFQQRGALRAELRPVSGSALPDLDLRRLKDYFGRIRGQPIPADDEREDWKALLNNTEIMSDDAVSMAGLLLFGLTPYRFLPQSGIDATAFPGNEKDYAALERASLRGPMTRLDEASGQLLESGLVEQAMDFVRRNTKVLGRIEEGGRRIEKRTYPLEAVREAIVNALIHRDYLLLNTDIELSIYSDRLEVISPGRLPNGITPDRMRAGTRASRNQLLKDVMRDYGYLEHLGLGVPRKIIIGMREHNGTEPELVEDGERFIVRLFE